MPEFLKLKIPNVPFRDSANRTQNLNYVTDAVGMAMDGINIVNTVAAAANVAKIANIAYDVSEHAGVVNLANGAGKMSLALGTLGVLTQYVSFWLNLAGAHAAAKANIVMDNLMRGLSTGAVLGADRVGPNFMRDNFWQWGRLHYPFYPELNEGARNIHNIGLLSGFAQGRDLSDDQIGFFFLDLRRRMTEGSRNFYSGDYKQWSLKTKKSYFLDCAALFRAHHMK